MSVAVVLVAVVVLVFVVFPVHYYRPRVVARRLAREPYLLTITLELRPGSGADHHVVLDVYVRCAEQARLVALLAAPRVANVDPLDAAIEGAHRLGFEAWAAGREGDALTLVSAPVPAEAAAVAGRALAEHGLVVHSAEVRFCVAMTPEFVNLRGYRVGKAFRGGPTGFTYTCNALDLHLDATLGRDEWCIQAIPVGGGFAEVLPSRSVIHDDGRTVRAFHGTTGDFVIRRTFRQMREGADVR